MFVQHVDCPADECSRIDVGDELVGIDDETYSANDADRVRELLAQRDSVKLKIKRKTKKGTHANSSSSTLLTFSKLEVFEAVN